MPVRARPTGKRWRRLLFRVSLGLGLAALLFLLLANLAVTRGSARYIVEDAAAVPRRTAAVIFGAKVYADGRLSLMLADRVETGLALYRRGKVDKLLLTGDHGRWEYEVNAMRRYLLARGAAPEDVFLDHAGFDTYDSLYRAREVFRAHGTILVTQAFHLPRAVYTARALGLDAVGVPADRGRYPRGPLLRATLREILARGKTFLEVLLRPRPRFLGPVIPVAGDGRQTWD
ncbi:MAG: vancomycin high temperature exclusion protein [Bacteroidota bacterium]